MTAEPETSIIARIMATGCNRHVRDHGPGGDYAGEGFESGEPWQCSGRYVASPGGRHQPMRKQP